MDMSLNHWTDFCRLIGWWFTHSFLGLFFVHLDFALELIHQILQSKVVLLVFFSLKDIRTNFSQSVELLARLLMDSFFFYLTIFTIHNTALKCTEVHLIRTNKVVTDLPDRLALWPSSHIFGLLWWPQWNVFAQLPVHFPAPGPGYNSRILCL